MGAREKRKIPFGIGGVRGVNMNRDSQKSRPMNGHVSDPNIGMQASHDRFHRKRL